MRRYNFGLSHKIYWVTSVYLRLKSLNFPPKCFETIKRFKRKVIRSYIVFKCA